jgi:hypothetical protein
MRQGIGRRGPMPCSRDARRHSNQHNTKDWTPTTKDWTPTNRDWTPTNRDWTPTCAIAIHQQRLDTHLRDRHTETGHPPARSPYRDWTPTCAIAMARGPLPRTGHPPVSGLTGRFRHPSMGYPHGICPDRWARLERGASPVTAKHGSMAGQTTAVGGCPTTAFAAA